MLIFDHLFKTGGTTVQGSYLPAAFSPHERVVLSGFRDANVADQAALAAAPASAKDVQIISGHNAGALRETFPDARFITLVRDPVNRAISAYFHALHHPDAQAVLGTGEGHERLTFQAFVEEDTFASKYWPVFSIHDGQARALLGDDFARLDDSGIRRRLAERYVAVGHTERLDEFLFDLNVKEGLPLCLYNNRLVRRPRRTFQPTAEELAAVRSCNDVDERLHRIVCEDFQSHLDALPPAIELALQNYLRALRSFREHTGGDENAALRMDRGTMWEEARYHLMVFGTFPGCRNGHVTMAIPLEGMSAEPECAWHIVDGLAAFVTRPSAWSYLSTCRWPTSADGVRVVIQVRSGELGLAVTAAENAGEFITEASVGPTVDRVAVELWPTRAPGWLVLRNRAPHTTSGEVLAVHALQAASGV